MKSNSIVAKDWVAPAWRSALLPGWGQAYNGETGKGWVVGCVDAALVAGVITTFSIGTNAENQYHSLGAGASASDFNGAYNTWSNMATANYILYACFGVVYTYGIVDGIWNAKPIRVTRDQAAIKLTLLTRGIGAQAEIFKF